MSMSLEQAFEVAINDAINTYVREILLKRGFIIPDKANELWKPELLNLKYKLAQDLARGWGKMKLQIKIFGPNEALDLYVPVQSLIEQDKKE